MRAYLDLLADVLANGTPKDDRTGTGTLSVFGRQVRFHLGAGFPLLTTKRIHVRAVVAELLWFLSGDTNANTLRAQGVTIWDEWAAPDGDLGPVYGRQWRSWATPDGGSVDQIAGLLRDLVRDPDSRRLVVSAWNPADLARMALAPCHCLFQFYTRPVPVRERYRLATGETEVPVEQSEAYYSGVCDRYNVPRRYLDLQLYQRSADIFLGVPFNVASYALLVHLVARQVGMVPGDFVHTFGDLHLYRNHEAQAREQLARRPGSLPRLQFTPDAPRDLFAVRREHIGVVGYYPAPAIPAPVAV